MKSIQELKEKQEEYDKIYDKYKDGVDVDEIEKREKCIISGHWVDFISDLLDYNFSAFMEKNGYTDEDIDNTFFIDDPEVQKEMAITEKQAKEELKSRIEYCNLHPYGAIHNFVFDGIYLEKIELDILKWFLEIED